VFAWSIEKILAIHSDPEVKRKLLGADVKLTQGLAQLCSGKPPENGRLAVELLIDRASCPTPRKTEQPRHVKPKQVAESLVRPLKARGRSMREPGCSRWHASWGSDERAIV